MSSKIYKVIHSEIKEQEQHIDKFKLLVGCLVEEVEKFRSENKKLKKQLNEKFEYAKHYKDKKLPYPIASVSREDILDYLEENDDVAKFEEMTDKQLWLIIEKSEDYFSDERATLYLDICVDVAGRISNNDI